MNSFVIGAAAACVKANYYLQCGCHPLDEPVLTFSAVTDEHVLME
jgi:hypothetical protein